MDADPAANAQGMGCEGHDLSFISQLAFGQTDGTRPVEEIPRQGITKVQSLDFEYAMRAHVKGHYQYQVSGYTTAMVSDDIDNNNNYNFSVFMAPA